MIFVKDFFEIEKKNPSFHFQDHDMNIIISVKKLPLIRENITSWTMIACAPVWLTSTWYILFDIKMHVPLCCISTCRHTYRRLNLHIFVLCGREKFLRSFCISTLCNVWNILKWPENFMQSQHAALVWAIYKLMPIFIYINIMCMSFECFSCS